MRAQKALLPFKDGTWIERQVADWFQAGGQELIAVCSAPVMNHMQSLTMDSKSTFILQEDPKSSMADSLRLGFQKAGRQGLFILPVDVPLPKPSDLLAMEASMSSNCDVVVPRNGGHPVLITSRLLERLRESTLTWRLDEELIACKKSGRMGRCDGDFSHSALNLNTPQDWDAWKRTKL